MAISFGGIQRAKSIGGGCLKPMWDDASSYIGVDTYNVYIRAENSYVFVEDYIWASVRNDLNSVIIRHESDRITPLRNDICYYIGVTASDITGIIDGNTYVIGMQVYGDGSAPIEVPDRKITKII